MVLFIIFVFVFFQQERERAYDESVVREPDKMVSIVFLVDYVSNTNLFICP